MSVYRPSLSKFVKRNPVPRTTRAPRAPRHVGFGALHLASLGLGNPPAGVKPVTAARPAAAAPVAAPAVAAPADGSAPLPVDPIYDAQHATDVKQRDDAHAAIGQKRAQTLTDYGYTAQPDGSLVVDPSNPFSRAALLQRSYTNSKRGTLNSYAAQGQLYAGSLTNAQGANDFNYLQGQNTLKSTLGSILANLVAQDTGVDTSFDTNETTAAGDRVSRAQTNPLYSPVPPTTPTATGVPVVTGSTAQPTTTKRGRVGTAVSNQRKHKRK